MAAANRGSFAGPDATEAAKAFFDSLAETGFQNAHPLLKSKFPTKESLPNYYLQRERAAAEAASIARSRPARSDSAAPAANPRLIIERSVSSRDGLLSGRPDLIDLQLGEVIDYKTGARDRSQPDLSPAERRQLLFYAHLAIENGWAVSRGTVIRGDGSRASIELSLNDIDSAALAARRSLARYNECVDSGMQHHEIATPSPEACRWCPCIPFCNPFWASYGSAWEASVGVHVQGLSESPVSDGRDLVSLKLDGSSFGGPSEILVPQVPKTWIIEPGESLHEGTLVRIVHARAATELKGRLMVQVSKNTSIWVGRG